MFKLVLRWEPPTKTFRLFRVSWGRVLGDPGFTRQLTVALTPRLLFWQRECGSAHLVFAGLRLHVKSNPRGCFAA